MTEILALLAGIGERLVSSQRGTDERLVEIQGELVAMRARVNELEVRVSQLELDDEAEEALP